MIYKSFVHLSRHAALAKSLWTGTNPSSQQALLSSTRPYTTSGKQQQQQQQQQQISLTSLDGKLLVTPIIPIDPASAAPTSTPRPRRSSTSSLDQPDLPQKPTTSRRYSISRADNLSSQLHKHAHHRPPQQLRITTTASAVAAYRQLKAANKDLSTAYFESILDQLSTNLLSDATPQDTLAAILSVYTDAVSGSHKPSSRIYASVIYSLIALADHTDAPPKPRSNLVSTTNRPANGDSADSLYRAALDIYTASNCVNTQNYSPELYVCVILAATRLGAFDLLYAVPDHLAANKTHMTARIAAALVKGYGKRGDIKAAVECYQHYKFMAPAASLAEDEYALYAALVRAYCDCQRHDDAVIFAGHALETAVDHPEPAGLLVAELIAGHARAGLCAQALPWLEHVDAKYLVDDEGVSALAVLSATITAANDADAAKVLYQYALAQESISAEVRNVIRGDYLIVCAGNNLTLELLEAIAEASTAQAVWGLSTVAIVTRHLLRAGHVALALRTFENAPLRDPVREGAAAVTVIVDGLRETGLLTPELALRVLFSPAVAAARATAFSDPTGGAVLCVALLHGEYLRGNLHRALLAHASNARRLMDVLLAWAHIAGADNSLGGLAISAPLAEGLRCLMAAAVDVYTHQQKHCPQQETEALFREEVYNVLSALQDHHTLHLWMSFCASTAPQGLKAGGFAHHPAQVQHHLAADPFKILELGLSYRHN
ncbi:hypothetical protein D0Z00_002213 [Geotrichum galactomycetum]|uniref:Uncharacterized protein n=1 Tax=Geotrichum galactomycetum TaxID=27317 RepID=A0ACB6V4T4_9ASCO|nr:hypothetical protein D0Z00_002213 [Geotrichum candidum]